MGNVPSRTVRAVLALDRGAKRPWFLPVLGVFPLLDYVVPIMPNQMLLVTLSALQAHRWIAIVLTFAVATCLGAFGIAWAIQTLGGDWIAGLRERASGRAASPILDMLESHGVWVLTALALLPWPPRTAVLVCAVAGLPPASIAAAVGAGRLVSASVIACLAAHSSQWLRRFTSIDRMLAAVEEARLDRVAGSARSPKPVPPGERVASLQPLPPVRNTCRGSR